jgi:phospholipid/cholesterol/gamma-HCH transport system substrate-binding protein
MEIDNTVKVPDDSAAAISSMSLLGGMVLGIEPGGSEDMLQSGGEIQYTQAPQNLEELLGKFIFSMQNKEKKEEEKAPALAPISESIPAPAPSNETPESP